MTGSKVLVERRGAVSVLTLNRPEVRNCIDAETAGLVSEAIQTFAADAEASALVVAGAGTDAFCSGADLKDIEALVDRDDGRRRAPLGFSDLEPSKPRIAAVEGWCIAGDVATFAAFSRRWGVPWVDGGTQRMTRRVGVGNALSSWRARPGGLLGRRSGPRPASRTRSASRDPDSCPRSVRLDNARPGPRLSPEEPRLGEGLAAPGRPLEEGLASEAMSGRAAETEDLRRGVRRFVERRR